MTLFSCGDVMTGRGIDQILPHPSGPQMFEPYVQDAREYVELAESLNGPISKPVAGPYIWGDALAEFERVGPMQRSSTWRRASRSDDYWKGKGINYRMHPENIACVTAARIDACGLANNHVLDYGYAGLTETLDVLTRAGLRTVGARRSLAEARAPAVVPLRTGSRLIIVAFGTKTSGIPASWAAREDRPGVKWNLGPPVATLSGTTPLSMTIKPPLTANALEVLRAR